MCKDRIKDNYCKKDDEIVRLQDVNKELYDKAFKEYSNVKTISFDLLHSLEKRKWIKVHRNAHLYVLWKSKKMIIILYDVVKGASVSIHQHDCKTLGKVIKGSIEELVEGEQITKGGKFKTSVNQPHSYKALEDSKIIEIYHKC